ncbi:hypothetical protein [Zunongwangia profunda]|jgi:hypothetical protein|uniref:hypothetical protein n=1 Tax=Zunongwangia profunda TaxID=398743 RepID=UPI001D190CEA|nr:hypothetical protein [Zunongwangia profunda]MCC4228983.1 hypothetical protein [Zunongwangia profunda]|tara:strand:- start:1076 stop:1912 length:837 start_codon:yes stop_codon:yes gene_type:complete
MKKLLYAILLIQSCTYAQIPLKSYKNNITSYSQDSLIKVWDSLQYLDQKILLNENDVVKYDSISISNMMKSALLINNFGVNQIEKTNIVPAMNFIHSLNYEEGYAYWPIIAKITSSESIQKNMGGVYPNHILESFFTTMYNYSLLRTEDGVKMELLKKLNTNLKGSITTVPDNLLLVYEKLKSREALIIEKELGEWKVQQLKGIEEANQSFKLLLMNDSEYYIKIHDRLIPLVFKKEENSGKIFTIKNDIFDWYYKFDGENLSLFNDKNKLLIKYNRI